MIGTSMNLACGANHCFSSRFSPRTFPYLGACRSRAASLSDAELVAFEMNNDLVEVRSGPTAYGQIIFGKIKIPAIHDEKGEGFVHIRYATDFRIIGTEHSVME